MMSWGRPGTGAEDREVRLPGTRDQVARARRMVSGALGRDHPLHDDCVLLTSEIVTNAVLHSDSGRVGAFTLTVSYTADRVRVSVRDDGSARPPCGCHADPYSPGGRGLPLLEALSRRWGVTREAGANNVWFELVLDLVGASAVPSDGRLFNR